MLKYEEGERKDGNKVEGQEDAIFIRLGSKHERPQTLYQKTDPEYQSFEDFRRDGRKIRSAQSGHLCRRLDACFQLTGLQLNLPKWLAKQFPLLPLSPKSWEPLSMFAVSGSIFKFLPVRRLNMSRAGMRAV